MTSAARVVAQAKVNLVLRVLAREANGYHSIETVFLRLDLGDVVQVRTTASGRAVDCVGPAMPSGGLGPAEKNLAYAPPWPIKKQPDGRPGSRSRSTSGSRSGQASAAEAPTPVPYFAASIRSRQRRSAVIWWKSPPHSVRTSPS